MSPGTRKTRNEGAIRSHVTAAISPSSWPFANALGYGRFVAGDAAEIELEAQLAVAERLDRRERRP